MGPGGSQPGAGHTIRGRESDRASSLPSSLHSSLAQSRTRFVRFLRSWTPQTLRRPCDHRIQLSCPWIPKMSYLIVSIVPGNKRSPTLGGSEISRAATLRDTARREISDNCSTINRLCDVSSSDGKWWTCEPFPSFFPQQLLPPTLPLRLPQNLPLFRLHLQVHIHQGRNTASRTPPC